MVPTIPVPALLAALPRTASGLPIPATVAWDEGAPVMTEPSPERRLLCLLAGRCAICGGELQDGVWHVAHGPAVDAVADALACDREAPELHTSDPPGHLACMIYAAIVHPHLVSLPSDLQGAGTTALVEFSRHYLRPTCHMEFDIVLLEPRRTEAHSGRDSLLQRLAAIVEVEPHHPRQDHAADIDFGPDEDKLIAALEQHLLGWTPYKSPS